MVCIGYAGRRSSLVLMGFPAKERVAGSLLPALWVFVCPTIG